MGGEERGELQQLEEERVSNAGDEPGIFRSPGESQGTVNLCGTGESYAFPLPDPAEVWWQRVQELSPLDMPRREILDVYPGRGSGEFGSECFWPWFVVLHPTLVYFAPHHYIDRSNLRRNRVGSGSARPRQLIYPSEVVYLYQVLPYQQRADRRVCHVNVWDVPARLTVKETSVGPLQDPNLRPASLADIRSCYREIFDLWLRKRIRQAGRGCDWLSLVADDQTLILRGIHVPLYRALGIHRSWRRALTELTNERRRAWLARLEARPPKVELCAAARLRMQLPA